jgi:uncharacterized protein YgiM (DUF1202 family)
LGEDKFLKRPERESDPRNRGFADPRVTTSPSGRFRIVASNPKMRTHMLHSDTMKIVRVIIIILISLSTVIAAIFFSVSYFKEKPAGIFVDSSPISDVYINGRVVGKTPYSNTYGAGEIMLKMVPVSTEPKLVAYETKITLVAGIETIVRRVFGTSEETSSGDVISFDKIGARETGLIVISIPENAQVSIDGLPQGFTPYKSTGISPAQHQITVKSPGYGDRIMTLKTLAGYRLSLFAKLAKLTEIKPIPTPKPEAKTYVEILTTPTGFLRVRTAPGTGGSEIGQVKPGDKYIFLSDDAATGWMEIQYEASAPGLPNGITGWVSGQFAKKILQTEGSTVSAGLR